ncbi:MAG: TlpA family protein disulfide reductase [Methylobacteriaceae bacterium]|nr:TlpA family protein disulfide reductase [Methylobacteriaceae bacterium]
MTEEQTPPPAPPRADGREALRVFAPHLALAGLIVVLGVGAVLYVMGGPRKEPAAAACAGSAALAAKTAPFSRGEVAALAPSKTPKPMPDLAFEGPDGRPMKLSDLRGRIVLLNLWATWCAPCRKEMPALDRLQAALGGKDFEVVALSLDTRNLDRRKPFLDSVGVKSLAFYADPKADSLQILKGAAKVVGLPTTILIDRRGCDLGVMAGPAEWDSPDAQALVKAAIDG